MSESNAAKRFTERVEVAGDQLVSKVNELVKEGNAKRVVIRDHDGKELLSLPLNIGVAAGGLVTLAAPGLAALGALAALVAKVTLEIERSGDTEAEVDFDPNSTAGGS